MTILKTIAEGESLAKLNSWTASRIEQAFVANFVANLMIARVGDLANLAFINSPTSTHKRFSTAMSPVDFWGYVLFTATEKELRKYLHHAVIAEIKGDAGRILDSRVDKILKTCKIPIDQINWQETIYSIMLLMVRFEINFPAMQGIVRTLYMWDKVGAGARAAAIGQVSRFLRMVDPTSPLVQPLSNMSISGFLSRIINPIEQPATKIKGFYRIAEDDAPADATSDVGSADSISPLPRVIFNNGRIIKRRRRAFKIRKWKDPSNTTSGNYSNVKIA